MNDAVQQSSVLSAYRSSLEPVYEEICGDTATYGGVEDAFNGYLEQLTAPPESIAQAFRDFLDHGQNCHESSLASRMNMNTQNTVAALKPAIASALSGPSFYEPFSLFRNSYFQLIEIIHSLNNSEFMKRMDEKGGVWQLNRAVMMGMWRTSGLAEFVSSNLLYEIAKKLFEIRSDDFETALIRAEHAMLLGLSTVIITYNGGLSPDRDYEMKPVIEHIEAFERAYWEIMNPLNWAARLFPETIKQPGQRYPKDFGILIHSAFRMEPLKHESPIVLMEFLERLFFVVARVGISLDLSIKKADNDPSRYVLVISSGHSIEALKRNAAISELGRSLHVTWNTPGILTSIFTRPFQTLRGVRHSIVIPLRRSGQPSPAANNGGHSKMTGSKPAAGNDVAQAATILQTQGVNGALLMSGSRLGLLPAMPVIQCAPLTITR